MTGLKLGFTAIALFALAIALQVLRMRLRIDLDRFVRELKLEKHSPSRPCEIVYYCAFDHYSDAENFRWKYGTITPVRDSGAYFVCRVVQYHPSIPSWFTMKRCRLLVWIKLRRFRGHFHGMDFHVHRTHEELWS